MSEIILNNISFSYDTNMIFNNLSQKFMGPGLNIILGRSGSGKSTLLSLMSSLLKPKTGSINIISKSKPAVVFQSPLLLDYLTLEENVSLSCKLNGIEPDTNEIKKIFESVGIEGLLKRYPKEVSGGEMMRASIARALICKNDIIILDEPTGQLDEKNSWEIYKILKDLAKDHLIILVTHDEKSAYQIADNLYLLEDGLIKPLKTKNTGETKEEKIKNETSSLSISNGLKIMRKYLRSKKLRVFLSTIFLAFALSLLYLGINLRFQLPNSINYLMQEFYNYNTIEIYKEETISASSGHLTLKRREALTEEELRKLNIDESYPCLSYFLSEQNEIYYHAKTNVVKILPCFKQYNYKLSQGHTIEKHDQIIVNKSFLKAFDINYEEAEGDTISIVENKIVYLNDYKNTDIYDETFDFHIVGLASENELFNTPTIYYSYDQIYDVLNKIFLPKISEEIGKLTSVIDLFYITNNMNDDFRSQKNIINIDDPFAFKETLKLSDNNITINSKILEADESSDTIISSLTVILVIFLFLFLLSALNLEFLAIYSLYDENIRLFALLTLYENTEKNKKRLTLSTSILFFLQTLIFFSIFSLLITLLINCITNFYNYPNFLKYFDIIAFLIVNILSIFISTLASSLPLKRIKNDDIKKELEGEE